MKINEFTIRLTDKNVIVDFLNAAIADQRFFDKGGIDKYTERLAAGMNTIQAKAMKEVTGMVNIFAAYNRDVITITDCNGNAQDIFVGKRSSSFSVRNCFAFLLHGFGNLRINLQSLLNTVHALHLFAWSQIRKVFCGFMIKSLFLVKSVKFSVKIREPDLAANSLFGDSISLCNNLGTCF